MLYILSLLKTHKKEGRKRTGRCKAIQKWMAGAAGAVSGVSYTSY